MADENKKKLFGGRQKEEPGWDDGSDEEHEDETEAGMAFSNKAISLYGGISGMLGAQFAKYLHQVFACNAYGIPLTSQRVRWYSTPQIAADIIIFFFLYAAMLGFGLLIALGLREVFLKDLPDKTDVYHKLLARGFFWMTVLSVIFFFLPVNVFLIGVP